MQTPLNNAEHLLAQGIEAVKAGDRLRARELLAQAIQLNPADERMWLWMSGAVETDYDRRRCLERVLQLNPGNQAAQRGLAAMAAATSALAPAPAPAPALAADPAPSAAPMPPPIVLSQLQTAEPAAPVEQAIFANSPPAAPPILRRLSEQTAPADAAVPADPVLPALPERGAGVQVMADMARLRSSMQPTNSRRVSPLILVLLVLLVVVVALAVLFALGYLG